MRDSFSHRICDDLCQVLMSYLSFEHKIQFECVSKQWKTCVYDKQNVLQINSNQNKDNLNKLVEKTRRFNLKAFESVLKKCTINKIIISCDTIFENCDKECILQLIIKYCNCLEEIVFDFNNISDDTLRQFGQKFGQKLRILDFHYNNIDYYEKYQILLTFCTNLSAFKYPLDLSLIINNNQLLVPKLTKVSINYRKRDIEYMKIVAKSVKNTVKSIGLSFVRDLDQRDVIDLMREIIQLKSLSQLILSFWFSQDIPTSLPTHFKAIGIQCKQIKRFQLTLEYGNAKLSYEVFNTMSFFKQLESLELGIDNVVEVVAQPLEISCHSLKECRNLTHLRLYYNKINDNFFVNIDLNLPKLKYLEIFVSEVTDKAMHSLAKLTKLETLKLNCYQKLSFVTDLGVCDLIHNCPQIKSISFNCRPNITHKTIEELIKLALNKPKIQFKHQLTGICREDVIHNDIVFSVIDSNALKNLPKNLIINEEF